MTLIGWIMNPQSPIPLRLRRSEKKNLGRISLAQQELKDTTSSTVKKRLGTNLILLAALLKIRDWSKPTW